MIAYLNNKELTDEEVKKIIMKSKILGMSVQEVAPAKGKANCYLVGKTPTYHMLYIPKEVTVLNRGEWDPDVSSPLLDLEGHLTIIGGKGLTDASYMLRYCNFKSYDFSNFDASNVITMEGMFKNCTIKRLELRDIKTKKLQNTSSMFKYAEIDDLILEGFNTSNVKDMSDMFSNFRGKNIDLHNLNTSKVENMDRMFYNCGLTEIDLKGLDTKSVLTMVETFCKYNKELVDIRGLNLSNVKIMERILVDCTAKVLTNNPKIIDMMIMKLKSHTG